MKKDKLYRTEVPIYLLAFLNRRKGQEISDKTISGMN